MREKLLALVSVLVIAFCFNLLLISVIDRLDKPAPPQVIETQACD